MIRVYIAWYNHERESLGGFESLCELRVYISTSEFSQTFSSVCIRLCKQSSSIFYFFYKKRISMC